METNRSIEKSGTGVRKRRIGAIIAAVAIALLAFSGTATGAKSISSCTTINQSNAPADGLVQLTASIPDSPAPSCVNITVSNIVFDGQDFTVDSDAVDGQQGINVSNASGTIQNITVRNVVVTDWNNGNGIEYDQATDGLVTNVNATNNQIGIRMSAGASRTNITKSVAQRNSANGLELATADLNVTGVQAINNDLNGFQVFSGSSRFRNDSALNNGATGFNFLSAGNNRIVNNTAVGNADALSIGGTEETVENLNIGPSTAADTTINATGLDVTVSSETAPPADPANEQNISRFIDVVNSTSNAFLNVTFQYADADVSGVTESALDIWKHNGSWGQFGTGSGTDAAANEIQYNVTNVGSVFAPLANTGGGGGGGGSNVVTGGGSSNDKPTAELSITPSTPTTGETTTFDASNSTDPDGSVDQYRWNIDNDQYTGEIVNITFTDARANHYLELTVIDDESGTDSLSRSFAVEEPTQDTTQDTQDTTQDTENETQDEPLDDEDTQDETEDTTAGMDNDTDTAMDDTGGADEEDAGEIPTEDQGADNDTTDEEPTAGDEGEGEEGQPGFGAIATLLAAATMLALRRRD